MGNGILQTLEALKLRGMHAVYDEVLTSGSKQRSTTEKILFELLKAEAAERHLRSIRYRMGQARFPVIKTLDTFKFTESDTDEQQIRSLYEGAFLGKHANLIFVGGTGTGKTHLAIAIAAEVIRNGSRAKFYNLVDLANELEQEKLIGEGCCQYSPVWSNKNLPRNNFDITQFEVRGHIEIICPTTVTAVDIS